MIAQPSSSNHFNKADWIEGMARGMAVLESFDTERQRLNATLTAQRTGLTRATARRHLLTLTHLGYLETDGQYYWLSAKVLGFAGSYLSGARLPRAVQPTLHQLSLATQLSCSVAVLQNDAANMLDITLRTIKMHRGNLKNKLELNTLFELTRFCDAHRASIEKIAKG
jgi:hypothetical protein